jgi:hypothetical protein
VVLALISEVDIVVISQEEQRAVGAEIIACDNCGVKKKSCAETLACTLQLCGFVTCWPSYCEFPKACMSIKTMDKVGR